MNKTNPFISVSKLSSGDESLAIDGASSATSPSVNQSEYAIVRFSFPDPERPLQYKTHNIELPLGITSNDLIVGLETAYHLGIDLSDIDQCYLTCELPIALLKGNRTLGECGVRNGSLITFKRR